MNFKTQSTFATLLMALLFQNNGMGIGQAFDLKQCTRLRKMTRWAPKLVKKIASRIVRKKKKRTDRTMRIAMILSLQAKKETTGQGV